MKIAGIIAEYNPFHNGHKYHIEQSRSLCDPDVLIACGSGSVHDIQQVKTAHRDPVQFIFSADTL